MFFFHGLISREVWAIHLPLNLDHRCFLIPNTSFTVFTSKLLSRHDPHHLVRMLSLDLHLSLPDTDQSLSEIGAVDRLQFSIWRERFLHDQFLASAGLVLFVTSLAAVGMAASIASIFG